MESNPHNFKELDSQIASSGIAEIAEALSKAQGKFKQPALNRTARIKNAQGHLLYETHYADLGEIINCVKTAMAEEKLSFTQTIENRPPLGWVLVFTLMHASGEMIQSILPINISLPPQQLGGLLTYLKRYQASAFLGLAADFDDDANGVSGKDADITTKQPKENKKPATGNTSPDPLNYVLPAGPSGIKGLKIKDVPLDKLQKLEDWLKKNIAIKPPLKNVGVYQDAYACVMAHLENKNVPPSQPFPPDDVPAVNDKAKDWGDWILPKTIERGGRPLSKMSEEELKNALMLCEAALTGPPSDKTKDYFEAKLNIRAFLHSVGVEI